MVSILCTTFSSSTLSKQKFVFSALFSLLVVVVLCCLDNLLIFHFCSRRRFVAVGIQRPQVHSHGNGDEPTELPGDDGPELRGARTASRLGALQHYQARVGSRYGTDRGSSSKESFHVVRGKQMCDILLFSLFMNILVAPIFRLSARPFPPILSRGSVVYSMRS